MHSFQEYQDFNCFYKHLPLLIKTTIPPALLLDDLKSWILLVQEKFAQTVYSCLSSSSNQAWHFLDVDYTSSSSGDPPIIQTSSDDLSSVSFCCYTHLLLISADSTHFLRCRRFAKPLIPVLDSRWGVVKTDVHTLMIYKPEHVQDTEVLVPL